MCHADITFVLALLALVAGAFLVFSTKMRKDISAKPCAIIGYIVVVLSIIVLLISGYGIGKGYVVKKQKCSMMQGKMPTQQGQMQPKITPES